MRLILISCVVFLLCLSGCNVQTGLAPVENTIVDSSDRDFGFTGTWIPTPNPEIAADLDAYLLTIERDGLYTATLTDSSGESDEALVVQFRTYEISEDHPHAIVELECKDGEKIAFRRLAFAEAKDDHLYLWMIDGRKIGQHLFDDGIAAVVEHFSFSTTVRCESTELLKSLAKHSSKIVGPAQVFRRQLADEPQTEFIPKSQVEASDFQFPNRPKSSALEQMLRSEYIGLTVEEARFLAQQQNRGFRIGREDGKFCVKTAELCSGRITASVKNGLVSSIEIEPSLSGVLHKQPNDARQAGFANGLENEASLVPSVPTR